MVPGIRNVKSSDPEVFWRCSQNMQQIYRRAPMSKCDFNKVTKQPYWNYTPAWLFFCKFTAYYQNTFSYEHLRVAASETYETSWYAYLMR